jgi:hypothetical protein
MSKPIMAASTDPPEEDVYSVELSGQVGACVTPPVDDGHA